MSKLFVYGTLMFDEVWQQLIQGHFHKQAASLNGYKRVELIGKLYPAIKKDNSNHVDGILISGINDKHFKILDRFEGDYYCRTLANVKTMDNAIHSCNVYVFNEKYRHLLSRKTWDCDNFKRNYLKQFLNDCRY